MRGDELESPEEEHSTPEQGTLPLHYAVEQGGDAETPHTSDSEYEAPAGDDDALRVIIEDLETDSEPVAEPEVEADNGAPTPELPFEGDEPATSEPTESASSPDTANAAAEAVESQDEPSAVEPVVADDRAIPFRHLWPFIVYDLTWVAFVGLLVWQLLALPPETAVYDSAIYAPMLYAGVILTAIGPLLVVPVWLLARRREGGKRQGLFATTLVAGACATLIGVALWWTALLVVDYVRLGQMF